MTITRDVLVDIMRTPDLKDKHAGFVGFEDIHNWTWCYDKSRLGGCNNVYSMQEVQRLYALGIPTETPEEKEVLDSIESAGEAEWSGEGLPPVGVECEALDYDDDTWRLVKVLDAKTSSKEVAVTTVSNIGIFGKLFWATDFRKPETPQQRKDRERLEVIDEMCWDVHSLKVSQASALYEAGYRKEKTHGTN